MGSGYVIKLGPITMAKFLVIDIKTGAYEIDADDLVATKRLLASCPMPSFTACASVFQPPIESVDVLK